MKELNAIGDTYVVQSYKITWGSYKHILAILDLLERALCDGNEYFHILSANTIPTLSLSEIKKFFDDTPKEFIEVKRRQAQENSWGKFEYRYTAYFFQDIVNVRSSNKYLRLIMNYLEVISAKVQYALHLRRGISFDYKGYEYCHLSRKAVDFILKYVESNPLYIQEIRRCYFKF